MNKKIDKVIGKGLYVILLLIGVFSFVIFFMGLT
jgi:hypothetical protein